ncbi:hypothetical protein TRFO_07724 [Tritrichomonas foetus]|uniref:Uncharacterized protein n=1 Tax=Tritrichomonas foetus TaxID=1144522 RepID=A0A1J4JRI5_9EUKA|nr:hypothetical protein TRFO_07724 [Tritrichomonas foetus]|eukprot:OHT01048.1 hypothetical protein TRFO_07724 [Tritrichomonas foetus]
MSATWKKFSILPKAIKVESSDDSDDEIPDEVINNSMKRFVGPRRTNASTTESTIKPQNQSHNSGINSYSFNNNSEVDYSTMTHSQLMSQNFSSFSVDKVRNLPDTTIESLQQDSMRLLVNEATDKNNILKRQRDQLALELRQIKRESNKKVDEQRNRLEKLAHQLEKVTASCRNQKRQAEKELEMKLEQRNLNERFIAINDKNEYIEKTQASFSACSETVLNLAKILVYDVITENDFDILESTSNLDSPVGQCVKEFLSAAKSVIVKNQTE